MIAIISPAKRLDFKTKVDKKYSNVRFNDETRELIEVLRKKSAEEVQSMMNLSDRLANLNLERYHNFNTDQLSENAKQAVFAFHGDVYQGLEAETLNEDELDYAQNHLRILSGLYGLLRPLDLIQPYRLEMGTKFDINGHSSLYSFWGDKIAKLLQKDLDDQQDNLLLNLASNEYYKAVNEDSLNARIIDVEFKDFKNGKYKIISFYAKKARGLMARFMIKNKITKVDELKGFDYGGYEFDDKESTENKLAFKRG